MKEIIAQTFTPSYDQTEDRIRLAINYEDAHNRADFMITRSFILELIPTIQEFIFKNYPDEDYDFEINQNTNDLQNIPEEKKQNSEAISATDSANFELYKQDEELLREINLSCDANTKLTTLTLRTQNIVAQAQLNFILLNQVTKIIRTSIPDIKWGISHNF